jgi:hypothetical protein
MHAAAPPLCVVLQAAAQRPPTKIVDGLSQPFAVMRLRTPTSAMRLNVPIGGSVRLCRIFIDHPICDGLQRFVDVTFVLCDHPSRDVAKVSGLH